jgi:predicted glutamine amidotransferase
MCRLMGYVSHEKKSFPQVAGAGFDDFVALSSIHCDGWGVSTIDHDEVTAHLVRAAEMAHSSPQFESVIAESRADGGLLHLRWATAGLPISENNAHPFIYQDFTFIHNGSITPPASVEPFVSPEFLAKMSGETDSERYFYALLTSIEKFGFIEGVLKGVAQIKSACSYSSINAMIMNEDTYIAICEHDPAKRPAFGDDTYYELKYRSDADGVVVASSGWPQDGWEVLPNHHVMVVDRKTFATKIVAL